VYQAALTGLCQSASDRDTREVTVMTTQFTRGRTRAAAAAVLCGIASLALAACAAPAPASTTAAAATQQLAANASSVGVPVVVDCAVHGQTRPGQYPLACASGGAYLSGLHWASWGPSAAFADGTVTIDDCVPNCTAGHGHSFPVLVTLWRAQAWPDHAGGRYFTRMTIIHTGSHSYRAGGTVHRLPETVTYPLSPFGGA
jgi:hypothetical protein